MIRALSLMFFMIGVAAQSADTVVRTGEHGNFTRIFLSGKEAAGWQVEKSTEGYWIELTSGTEVDLVNAFDRIDRSRVKDIEQLGDGLKIHLSCDCGVRSFPIVGQGLVIDLSEQFVEDGRDNSQTVSAELGDLDWKIYRRHPSIATTTLQPNFFEIESGTPSASEPNQNLLVSEIAAAATQGGLSATQKFVSAGTRETRGLPTSASEQIRLSRDAFNQRVDPATRQIEEAVCQSEFNFSIASWGNPDSMYSEISEARRNLIDEAGQVDLRWLHRLVRSHIYVGQGREANSILSSFPAIENRQVLGNIARLVEFHAGSAPVLGETTFVADDCHTGLNMWLMLSGGDLVEEDKHGVLAEFSSLPPHLRTTLGPALIDVLVRDNDFASARLVRSALERLDIPASLELKEAYARMHDELGEVEPAREIYHDILQAGELGAPEVAVRLVEIASEADSSLSAGTTDLIDALSFEHQGTDEGGLLKTAMIKGLILEGQLSTAIDELYRHDFSEQDQSEIEQLLFSTISTELTPQELVNLYIHNPRYFLESLRSEQTRSHVGGALAETGFAVQAQKLGIAVTETSTTLASEAEVNSEGESGTNSNFERSENLVVRGGEILSESKSSREDIASLLSLIR